MANSTGDYFLYQANPEKLDNMPGSKDNSDRADGVYGEVIHIRKSDLKPLNNPDCKHEYERDESEDTDYYYGIKCKKCPVGQLISK